MNRGQDGERIPLILFGAFDRHNFGDLLFPHVAAASLSARELVFAGLAERDLRPWGGHKVEAVSRLAAGWEKRYGDAPAEVIHVGGELLSCDAWEAAVMLLPPEEAGKLIGQLNGTPQRFAWAQRYLGVDARAPYCLAKSLFRHPGRFIFSGVGGVDLGRRDPVLREEVLANLHSADEVGVRDGVTLEILSRAGIEARIMPDPVAKVAELFGERILAHAEAGAPAALRRPLPQGYLAVQLSASVL